MNFNRHSNLEGQHAFLGASKYHWINYTDDKIADSYLCQRRLAIASNTQQHIPFCCFAGTFSELKISFASSNLLIDSSSKYCHKLLPTYP